MRKLSILAIAAMLLIGSMPAASAHSRSGQVYFGYAEGVVTFDFGNPKGCESGFTTVTDTSGWALRTGRTDMDSTHCVVPYGAPEDNLATVHSAEMVLTARNGDEIHAKYELIIKPFLPNEIGQKVVAEGTVTFDGGTGRYEDATGTAYIRNVVTFEGFEDPEWASRAFWIGRIDT